jgi:hypothetical protein
MTLAIAATFGAPARPATADGRTGIDLVLAMGLSKRS